MSEESAYAKPQLRQIEGYYTGNVFCIDPDFGRTGDCSSGFTFAVTARSPFPTSAAVHASSLEYRPIGFLQSNEYRNIAHSRAVDRIACYSIGLLRRRNFTLAKLGRHGDCTLSSVELYPHLRV